MGWFLVIIGALSLLGGFEVKANNPWVEGAGIVASIAGAVAVIALGVAVNQGWTP